jgi:hypothetical protein
MDNGAPLAYKPSSARLAGDTVEEETAMKSKKTTKRLRKSKKLEATKPLLSITKVIDKTTPL